MFNSKNTVFAITDPRVEFLRPKGVGYSLTKDIFRKYHTTESLTELFKHAKAKSYEIFISPRYFYDHDQNRKFGDQGEQMMLNNKMFHREHQYQETVKDSGADLVEELKPYSNEDTITISPHKIFGPESNDLALQLHKNGINTVILAEMNANLCVDSHLRELVESGFHVHVAADATGAPGREAYDVAITNFGFAADRTMSTVKVLEEL